MADHYNRAGHLTGGYNWEYYSSTSGTYKRARKRRIQQFDEWFDHKDTPRDKRNSLNSGLERRAREIGHVNRVHKKWMAKGAFNGRKWKMMAMPALRHMSRAEINQVRANVKASTGRSSG